MEKREVTKIQSDELNNNRFIQYAMKAYNIATSSEPPFALEDLAVKSYYWNWKFPFIHKKIDHTIYTNKDKLQDEIITFIRANIRDTENLPFSIIWKYCQFIRWVEKTCFYHNDLTKSIICDSAMYSDDGDTNKRVLIFQTNDVVITLNLEKQSVSVLDLESDNNIFNNILTIDIKRKYGKMSANKYVVVDSKTNIRDNSDNYLLNTINIIIKEGIIDQYKSIINFILSREFLQDFKYSN